MTSRSSCEAATRDLFRGGPILMKSDSHWGSAPPRQHQWLLFLGGGRTFALVSEILDTGGNNGAAMNSRQRPMIAEVVQILANGVRAAGDFETQRDLPPSPGKGAGDIQDLGLAGVRPSQGNPQAKGAPLVRLNRIRSTRQSVSKAVRWPKAKSWLKRLRGKRDDQIQVRTHKSVALVGGRQQFQHHDL